MPSALIATPTEATALWVFEPSLELCDLHELFVAETGLRQIFHAQDKSFKLQAASRYLPLPSNAAIGSYPVALIANGMVKSLQRKHIMRTLAKDVSSATLYSLKSKCEALQEIGDLLFDRVFFIARTPEYYPILISCYVAASIGLVPTREVYAIATSVAESLENKSWRQIADSHVPGQSISYRSYLEILVRNAREGMVRLGKSYYECSDSDWGCAAADLLNVSQREVNELQLNTLVPSGMHRHEVGYFRRPKPLAIGKDDCVPIKRFLMHAA